MSVDLYSAHNQWATRPADERFWGLDDLGHALKDVRTRSYQRERPASQLQAAVHQAGTDGADLVLTTGSSGAAKLTHWSMSQICTYADAPASYIRTLPPQLAADCINNGLSKRKGDTSNLLIHRNDGQHDFTLRSITTAQYSRLWNDDIVDALVPATERGWMVPPARPASGFNDPRARPATAADIVPGQDSFGMAVKVGQMISPAGCYASDRDMFIFMVNPNRVVDDGVQGLMRGVIIWNSEVGAGAFKVQAFYLENVCSNHIIWGAQQVQNLRVVHKGNAIRNITHRMGKQFQAYSNQDTSAERAMIRAARQHMLGTNRKEVINTLYNNKSLGLTQSDIESAYDNAEQWEHTAGAPPVSAWGFVHGLTRHSQTKAYTDARSKLDAAGGRILEVAAKISGVNTKALALPPPQ